MLDAAGWVLREATIDYWSGTTDDPAIGQWADDRARDYIEAERYGDWSRAGISIQGFAGVMSEHSFVGQSEQGTYVRFSSSGADDRALEFIRAGLKTTRIDFACTLVGPRDMPDVAYQIRYGDRLPARVRGKPPAISLYSKEHGGDTAYVGSHRSSERGRVYDKTRESQGAYPVGSWRWELQSRHERGNTRAMDCARRASRTEFIRSTVGQWFQARGVFAPWEPEGAFRPAASPRLETTDDRRMAYLRSSIAPMIERLRGHHSVHELRKVLGLLYDPNETIKTGLTRESV